jgi:hypothetical protein
VAELLE